MSIPTKATVVSCCFLYIVVHHDIRCLVDVMDVEVYIHVCKIAFVCLILK